MQVYRSLDTGTAKPTAEERHRVPHHLIDVVDLSTPFDAAQFVRLAQEAVQDIRSRGRLPLFCGGTGLYFRAYLEGLGEGPADPVLRAQLEQVPLPNLLTELEQRDPALFATIDRKNLRRVLRAVEVIRLTGRPFSEQRAKWSSQEADPSSRGTLFFGLSRESADLQDRINARVDKMFADGLVPEAQGLLGRGLLENRNALQSLGYRQVVEHLRGERSLPETIDLVKSRTRQFAKRQLTWFRRQRQMEWIHIERGQTASETATAILARIEAKRQAARSELVSQPGGTARSS